MRRGIKEQKISTRPPLKIEITWSELFNISQLSINDKFKIQYLNNLPANTLNEIDLLNNFCLNPSCRNVRKGPQSIHPPSIRLKGGLGCQENAI